MGENQELPQGQLIDIGTVAASNIAQTLGLPSTAVPIVRDAIRDEIKMIETHFSTTILDMQSSIESQIREVKSGFNWAKQNASAVWAAATAFFVAGFLFRMVI